MSHGVPGSNRGPLLEQGHPATTGAPVGAGDVIFSTGELRQGLRQGLRRKSPAGGASVLTLDPGNGEDLVVVHHLGERW